MNECDIFMAALEKDSLPQRKSFLDEACAGNANLRQRIESLLESHGQAGNLLEHPALGAAETMNPVQSAISTAGAVDGRDHPSALPDAISLDFLAPVADPQALGRLGPYTITQTIGRGGMGIVLRAHDPKLNRVIAIKVLAPELAANPTARRRFLREAQAAAAVVHQHVVTIHAVDDDRLPYLVMECIDGQSLQEKIDRAGHLELKEILRIGQQVAAGLAAAHANGLMHRDVKPANILLENGVQRVRITDFGLARAIDDVGMTKPGEVAGTPQYMSPEQAQGHPTDARSDLFSLGCVLYAMCTGRPPFRAETTLGIMRRVCEETPRPIREINPDIPQWLVAIIDRLLAKQPAERFQSAQEVANLLAHDLAHVQHPGTKLPGIMTAPARQTTSRRSRWFACPAARWRMIAAAVSACLLAGLGFSEAIGVTHLAGFVVRIVTGEGTLIVESDDPAVKVTIEGDGGLLIHGAGPQEVRLRPGSYKVRADKDGLPARPDRELVSIIRGDQQAVRVHLVGESSTAAKPTAATPTAPESHPFVILSTGGAVERKFATLAEAELAALDGDTIEIRGNGPFAIAPLLINVSKRLTVRAAEGYRPVISAAMSVDSQRRSLLHAAGGLVLEGLEFHGPAARTNYPIIVIHRSCYVANCRFNECRLDVSVASELQVRNSVFSQANGSVLTLGAVPSPTLKAVDNNIIANEWLQELLCVGGPGAEFDISRNLLLAPQDGFCIAVASTRHVRTPLTLNCSRNVLFGSRVLRWTEAAQAPLRTEEPSGQELESVLRDTVRWRGQQNAYPEHTKFIHLKYATAQKSPGYTFRAVEPSQSYSDLAQWTEFWGQSETGSIQGNLQFQRGELAAAAPSVLEPDAFRLKESSAGYRAGPEGEDLGPDIDLVGPGAAYERWKKTPEYEQWLMETGQTK